MTRTVEIYSSTGQKVSTFENVEEIVVFDKGYIKVRYIEGKKEKTIETNMPFIYHDGVKDL